jgi:hypothetical protein
MKSVKIGFPGTPRWRRMDNQFIETSFTIYHAFSVIFSHFARIWMNRPFGRGGAFQMRKGVMGLTILVRW